MSGTTLCVHSSTCLHIVQRDFTLTHTYAVDYFKDKIIRRNFNSAIFYGFIILCSQFDETPH